MQLAFQDRHWLACRGRNSEPLIHRDPTSAFSQEGAPPGRVEAPSVTAVLGAVAEGAASTPTPAGLLASEGCRCPATGRPSTWQKLQARTKSRRRSFHCTLPDVRETGRFPWHLRTALSQCIQPENLPADQPSMGFSVPGPQARTHQSWAQWWKKPGPPRAQLEERKQALKKIWQLEPLFLVLF